MTEAVLEEQFVDLDQQRQAYALGMWAFLASELMLFSGLLLAYTVGRLTHYQGFVAGSHELKRLLGGLNTAVLLTSSTTVAFAVERAKQRRWSAVTVLLLVTAALGSGFLGIKLYEWSLEFRHHLIPGSGFEEASRGTELFFWFYFVLTGLHAVHLTIGVLAMLTFAWLMHRRSPILLSEVGSAEGLPDPEAPSPIVMLGLYWHLVDLVWFFLYPALYMIGSP